MTTSRQHLRQWLALLLLSSLGMAIAQAETQSSSEPAQSSGNSVIDKTGHAINKGVTAAADGTKYVAEKTVNGVKRGAQATGDVFERGARATSHALDTAANKVGGVIGVDGSSSKNTDSSTQH